MTQLDPNYKFRKIADDAANVAMLGVELYALYKEAIADGISAYRETRIKNLSKQLEAGARRLREPVKTHKPEIVSQCEHCGHTVWRDD